MSRRFSVAGIVSVSVTVLWVVACFAVLQTVNKYHFYYQEQTQLFLNSASFARSYLDAPACAACLAGDFLTQFYYYTFAGPAILTACLLLLGGLSFASLRRSGVGRGVALAVALAGMSAVLFLCFCERYRLPSVLALAGGAAASLIVPRRGGAWAQGLSVAVLGALAYWAFGCGVLLFAALVLVGAALSWRGRPWRLAGLGAVLALVPAAGRAFYMAPADAFAYPGLGVFRLPSASVDRDLGVITEYGLGNKARVVAMVAASSRPSRIMKFYYNLVMAERGLLPDSLMRWADNNLGTFDEVSPATPLLVSYSLPDLYWALGDMTRAERAAMLANVFAPGNRNVRMTRRLAEVNIVSGDTAAARKYLRLLCQTAVYDQWAAPLLRSDPAALEPYRRKALTANTRDTITTGQNMHTVMAQLLDSNPRNTVALDYDLCSLLLLKDIGNFKRDYDRYCMSTGMPRAKRLYQEALCIFLAGSGAEREEWVRYVTDHDVLRRFGAYNQRRGSSDFADTYWYYFDKAPRVKARP